MSSDEDFPDWKVSLVAKYFRSTRPVNPAPGPHPRRMALVSDPEDHRDICQGTDLSVIKGQTMSVDVATSLGDRPESVTNCCFATSQGMDVVMVEGGAGSKDGRMIGLGEIKSKSKVVDYEIHSDSEEEENCYDNVDEESDGGKNEFKTVISDVLSEKDNVRSSNSILKEIEVLNKVKILDVEDSSDSDDEILSLKKIKSPPKVSRNGRNSPRPLISLEESAGENDPRIIVDVIIENLLGIVVSADPEVIAFEIINKCIDEMDDAAEKSESSQKFTFGSTDIRYRKNPPLPSPPKKNAVSVVVSGPPEHVASFTDKIKEVQRRTSYEKCSNDPAFFRMDLIFHNERDSQKFHDKVERLRLRKPQDLFLATVMVPEAQLCHKDDPRLSEEELLHFWWENRVNLFRGFEVTLDIDDGGKFFFHFESMISLNCFFFCAQQRPQLSKAFLGVVRQNTRVFEALELKPKKLRKGKKVLVYKMPVTFRETSVPSLKELGDKHKFKVFHQNFGRRGRPSSGTLEFTSKEDFYRFLVDKDCKKFEKVDFISTKESKEIV